MHDSSSYRSARPEQATTFVSVVVVCSLNKAEDMATQISELNPVRWKVFQCLEIDGENAGPDAKKRKREATKLLISSEEFQNVWLVECSVTGQHLRFSPCARLVQFLDRHSNVPTLVQESNELMRSSYLILDEEMRFLDCSKNGKTPSDSILTVGVKTALDKYV